ncbi:MAG: hypothetical protein K8L99_02815 [Anaerolineae bacterium]|nr:hypothetical protein [Anaerolineae bacterium]
MAYHKEWLADEQVLCYRFFDTEPATIDAWSEDLTSELLNWPEERPWRLLLDITLRGNIISAYALRQAREISMLRPELDGRLAILVSSPLAVRMISLAIRSTTNRYRQRLVFGREDKALQWLLGDEAL